MSVEILTMLFFGALLLFVMLGTPLAFALGGISVIFLYAEMGDLGFYLLASKMWETMQSPTLMAIPLFVFMAILLEKSGVANDLYDMMHEWWGGLRGGISIALALSLPPGETRDLILAATFAAVLFSVLVQRATLGRLIEKLKEDRAPAVEREARGSPPA